jgi:hypothetical protein
MQNFAVAGRCGKSVRDGVSFEKLKDRVWNRFQEGRRTYPVFDFVACHLDSVIRKNGLASGSAGSEVHTSRQHFNGTIS